MSNLPLSLTLDGQGCRDTVRSDPVRHGAGEDSSVCLACGVDTERPAGVQEIPVIMQNRLHPFFGPGASKTPNPPQEKKPQVNSNVRTATHNSLSRHAPPRIGLPELGEKRTHGTEVRAFTQGPREERFGKRTCRSG
ncbi:hypothetical protein chiPu_0029212 [Chiloscyllium punctatum]|uniref:Uncharacterized protein n=1 Tax=Chiloscyllium punctatum TaxID=137246 RepID=A0A401TS32_CHIPU|nr:hypothetical protein [Chiloscyllium punctatum]